MTTSLPLRGGHAPAAAHHSSQQRNQSKKDVIEALADPLEEEEDLKSKEKFAGLIPGSTVWKYNPNSEYNKYNDKRPGNANDY